MSLLSRKLRPFCMTALALMLGLMVSLKSPAAVFRSGKFPLPPVTSCLIRPKITFSDLGGAIGDTNNGVPGGNAFSGPDFIEAFNEDVGDDVVF